MSKSKIPTRGRVPYGLTHRIHEACRIGRASLQIVEMYLQPYAFDPDAHGVRWVAVLTVGRETYRTDQPVFWNDRMVRGEEVVSYALAYLLLNGGRVAAGRAGVKRAMRMFPREIAAETAISYALGSDKCKELNRTYVPWYELSAELHPQQAAA